eukprot:s1249_g8.t1
MQAWIRCSQPGMAEWVVHLMLQFLRPDTVSFNIVISAAEDHWAWALWLWSSRCGNTRTLNAASKSYEASTWPLQLGVLDAARQVSIRPDLVTFNTSAAGVTKEGTFIYGTTINEEEVVRGFREFILKFVQNKEEETEATYLRQLRKTWELQEEWNGYK